jgi:hypothetical protein
MTFPTSQIPTTNLDQNSDSPASARADLYQAVTSLNSIISGANSIGGVVLLDNAGRIPATNVPQSITYTGPGNQVINPSSKITNIQDIVRLTAQTKSDILSITTSTLSRGDLAMSNDGNSGTVALCLYDGTKWLRIHAQTPLSSTTPVITTAVAGIGTSTGFTSLSVGTVTTLPAGSNAQVSVSGSNGAYVLDFSIPQGAKGTTGSGGAGPGTFDTDVNGNAVLDGTNFNGVVNNGVSLTDITGTGKIYIDSWTVGTYHSAKYVVTVRDGSNFHVSEVMVLTNETDVFISEYGVMASNGLLGEFSASLNSGSVDFTFTPTGASNMAIMAAITKMAI